MAKKGTPERPRDVSQLAKRIVDISIGQESDEAEAVDGAAVKRNRWFLYSPISLYTNGLLDISSPGHQIICTPDSEVL